MSHSNNSKKNNSSSTSSSRSSRSIPEADNDNDTGDGDGDGVDSSSSININSINNATSEDEDDGATAANTTTTTILMMMDNTEKKKMVEDDGGAATNTTTTTTDLDESTTTTTTTTNNNDTDVDSTITTTKLSFALADTDDVHNSSSSSSNNSRNETLVAAGTASSSAAAAAAVVPCSNAAALPLNPAADLPTTFTLAPPPSIGDDFIYHPSDHHNDDEDSSSTTYTTRLFLSNDENDFMDCFATRKKENIHTIPNHSNEAMSSPSPSSLLAVSSSSSSAAAASAASSPQYGVAGVNPTLIDKQLANELHAMTVEDRNGIIEEIHGVSTCAIPEYDDVDDDVQVHHHYEPPPPPQQQQQNSMVEQQQQQQNILTNHNNNDHYNNCATTATTTTNKKASNSNRNGMVRTRIEVDGKLTTSPATTNNAANTTTSMLSSILPPVDNNAPTTSSSYDNAVPTTTTTTKTNGTTTTTSNSDNSKNASSSSNNKKKNNNSFIQDKGLRQLEDQICMIRIEILSNRSNRRHKHESKDGHTYNEHIWSYLDLNVSQEEDAIAEQPPPRIASTTTRTTTTTTTTNQPMAPTTTTSNTYPYIHHRSFRLKFLRAEFYDARKAAHRYLRCLECLLQFFGPYALQRPLRFDDLDKSAQHQARKGYIQILPSRDRSGRLVFVGLVLRPDHRSSSSSNSSSSSAAAVDAAAPILPKTNSDFYKAALQIAFYTSMVVSDDVVTQKRGMVFIFSLDESSVLSVLANHNPKGSAMYQLYREGQPVRRSCTHFCVPEHNFRIRILRSIMMIAMSKDDRVRTRIHMDGLTTETLHRLMTFGIPVSELPVTVTGQLKTKQHMVWIKSRKAIDQVRKKCLESCVMNHNKILKAQQQQQQQLLYDEHQRQQTAIRHGDLVHRQYQQQQQQPHPQYHHHHQQQQNDQSQQYQHNDLQSQRLFINFNSLMYPSYDFYLQQLGEEPITYPTVNDVLFSKGGKNVYHYGNIEFTDLMKHWLLHYDADSATSTTISGGSSSRSRKTANNNNQLNTRDKRKLVREKIINEIHQRGGRFLTLDKRWDYSLPNFWTEIINVSELHDRIATSLYDHKRRLSKKLSRTNNETNNKRSSSLSSSPSSLSLQKRSRFNDNGNGNDNDNNNDVKIINNGSIETETATKRWTEPPAA